jgi:thymidylate synthase (FAD)
MDYSVRLLGITQPKVDELELPEHIISYCARVSNPKNQTKVETAKKLLGYLIENAHWSPFEMVDAVVEIKFARDIARQALRHRSFSFQEFSQRYAEATDFTYREARLQDPKNRQNSIELDVDNLEHRMLAKMWLEKQQNVIRAANYAYQWALDNGLAKEVARVVLPEGLTMSSMTMKGSIRSWLHYCAPAYGIRTLEHGTQKEHYQVAETIWEAIAPEIPSIVSYMESRDTK